MTKKALSIIGFIAIVALGFYAYFKWWPHSQPQVNQTITNYTAPSNVDKHKEGTASGESPITERGTRKATITVRDTVKPADSVGTIKTHTIEVVIPKGENPIISVDRKAPSQKDVEIDVWTPPWFEISPTLVLGANINRYAEPSLYAGVSVVNLWERGHAGAGLDRFGIGILGAYEFKQNVLVFADWKLFEYHSKPVGWTIGVAVLI